jgi:chromosome segregation ATPase
MENQSEGTHSEDVKSPGWVIPAIVVLCVVTLAALGLAWRASTFAQESRQSLSHDMQTMKQTHEKTLDRLGQRLAEAERTNQNLQDDVSAVVNRLHITQSELKKAREEAQQIRDEEVQHLSVMDAEMRDQLALKASNEDMRSVNGQVDMVRTDLNGTKKDLQMARSEIGTLIAKNHEDIETLRRLGERDYVEFTIAAKDKMEKVKDVAIELRSTDPKRNQCSLTVVVDEKQMQKKNRNINEPIFFYMHGAHQPTEIVVNKVEKSEVAGYVSFPKASQPTSNGGGGY